MYGRRSLPSRNRGRSEQQAGQGQEQHAINVIEQHARVGQREYDMAMAAYDRTVELEFFCSSHYFYVPA